MVLWVLQWQAVVSGSSFMCGALGMLTSLGFGQCNNMQMGLCTLQHTL